MKGTREYPELIGEIREFIRNELADAGLSHEMSANIASHVAESVRDYFGGQMIYIPKGSGFELDKRDAEIWSKFNGANRDQLCREYGISQTWFYRIISAMKAKSRENQLGLFDGADDQVDDKAGRDTACGVG